MCRRPFPCQSSQGSPGYHMSTLFARSIRRSLGSIARIALLSAAGFLPFASVTGTALHAQVASVPAADEIAEVGVVWQGEAGITETVDAIMAREANAPPIVGLRLHDKPERRGFNRELLPQNPDSPAVSSWPIGAINPEPQFGERSPQNIGVEFLGMDDSESGFIPPDTIGDVGPSQIVVAANGRIKVFSKAGVLGSLNAGLATFFSSVNAGGGAVDPRVVYDRLSNRWFVIAITTATPNRIVIARSSGSSITGTSSFTFFQFQQDLVGTTPNADTNAFADYPSLGVDVNALYIGCNMFLGGGASGTTGWVINKANLLAGAPTLTVTAFRQMATAAGAGPFSPRGVTNDDPAATTGYFIGADNATFGRLTLRRIGTPGGTPTISANITLTVPTTSDPENVPAQGSTVNIEATNDRLFDARIRRNHITGIRSIWTAHAIEVNASGVASASGARNGVRWYQVSNYTATPALTQSGTLFDNSATAPDFYVYPTIAATGQGHMAVGASVGATDRFMSAVTAGRFRTDAAGTIQAPLIIEPGAAAYTVTFGGPRNRWGDYSSTVVDPTDDMTIWTIQEYCNGTNSWGLRVAQLRAPPPATPTACSPASLTAGASNVNVVVTGTPAAGSAFFDPEASFPNHIAANFSGTGITVNSVTFNSETQITINVTVAAGAAAGARDVTVMNPDGQVVTGSGLLSIAAGCLPASVNDPVSQNVCLGTGASFTVFGSGTPPYTFQWRKNTVEIGGATSNSLTFASTIADDAGSYDCVVTNGCGSDTSAAATLTIGTAPTISTQPDSVIACRSSPAEFTVLAAGATGFQWRLDNVDLPGETGSTLTISPVTLGDEGTYTCRISNTCGFVISDGAGLTFCPADWDCDGDVDSDDTLGFFNAWESGSGDFDGDDDSDSDDIVSFFARWEGGC